MKSNWKTNSMENCNWKDTQFQQQLEQFCHWLKDNSYINNDENIEFYTQHNRDDTIFRGDPCWDKNGPWYDWAYVNWGKNQRIPAKILIYIDLRSTFKKRFQYNDCVISSGGVYAIGYSLFCPTGTKPHNISLLMDWGALEKQEDDNFKLCIFDTNAIEDPCLAVPYKKTENIINATEWIFIKPRNSWSDILVHHLSHPEEWEEYHKNLK